MRRLIDKLARVTLYKSFPEEDVVSMQQFVLFRIFSYAGTLVCTGVFFKMILTISNAGFVPWIILSLAAIILTNFFAVKSIRGLKRAYLIMLLSAFLILHIVAYSCGGIRTGGTLYFSTIILYAFMLLGRKGGLWFSAATVAHLIYLFAVSSFTDWTSFSLFKENVHLINEDFLINGILTTFLIASQGSYLQSGKNVVIERLEKSKKLLESNYLIVEEKNNLLLDYGLSLEKSNKELEKFASVASHDLKAPLRAIGNLTGIIEDEAGHLFNEDVKNSFGIIKARVERMEQLLNALLDYSKADRMFEEFQIVDPLTLIKKIIPQVTENKNVEIIYGNKLHQVVSCPNKLQIIFNNIIENAVRFNDKNLINIKVSSEETDEHYRFSIEDNGPGIEEKYFEKIFVIFQTLNRRDEVESSGVGLSISKKIVEEFGGKIWIESTIGKGSCFYFTLNKIRIMKTLNSPLSNRSLQSAKAKSLQYNFV